jgi:hypothetical protein
VFGNTCAECGFQCLCPFAAYFEVNNVNLRSVHKCLKCGNVLKIKSRERERERERLREEETNELFTAMQCEFDVILIIAKHSSKQIQQFEK